jgi:hypothetical protein
MSKTTTPKGRRGRPALRSYQFAARMLSYQNGMNEKYCRALLKQGVSELGARGWAIVALAIEDECETLQDFEEFLDDMNLR